MTFSFNSAQTEIKRVDEKNDLASPLHPLSFQDSRKIVRSQSYHILLI